MSDGYVEALGDILVHYSDRDLWNRQTIEEQLDDAKNHLSTLQNKPPFERGNNFFRYKHVLEQLIQLVQDKLDARTDASTTIVNPYTVERDFSAAACPRAT